MLVEIGRVKIVAAFALCAVSYYNFLDIYNPKKKKETMAKKEMVDDSSALE